MNYCKYCNEEYEDSVSFCRECGAPLDGDCASPPVSIKRRTSRIQSKPSQSYGPGPVSDQGGCLRIIYFIFVGCWLGPIVESIGMFFLHTIILLFIGTFILERIPCFLTLRTYRWRPAKNQVNIVVRIVFFLLFGIWIGHLISFIAHFLNAILIGLPIGQDLMEKRGKYYSLKIYVPRNMPLDAEEPSPGNLAGTAILGVFTVILIVGGIGSYYIGYRHVKLEDIPKIAVKDISGLAKLFKTDEENEMAAEVNKMDNSLEMYKKAQEYYMMGHMKSSKTVLKYILNNFPESPVADDAKELLNQIQYIEDNE